MQMTASAATNRPIWGILSIILATLALLVIVYFALFGGIPYPLLFIRFALILLLALLVFGLVTGLIGFIQNEQPRWVSVTGLILTICLIVVAALFLNWLIG